MLVAQAVDQLGAQDVDLAVQDAPLVGDLGLLLGQLADESLSSTSVSEPRSGNVSSIVGSSPLADLRRARAGGDASTAGRSAEYSPKGKAELETRAGRRSAELPSPERTYSARGDERQREADVQQHLAERFAGRTIAKKSEPITGATASRPGQLMRSSTPRARP